MAVCFCGDFGQNVRGSSSSSSSRVMQFSGLLVPSSSDAAKRASNSKCHAACTTRKTKVQDCDGVRTSSSTTSYVRRKQECDIYFLMMGKRQNAVHFCWLFIRISQTTRIHQFSAQIRVKIQISSYVYVNTESLNMMSLQHGLTQKPCNP